MDDVNELTEKNCLVQIRTGFCSVKQACESETEDMDIMNSTEAIPRLCRMGGKLLWGSTIHVLPLSDDLQVRVAAYCWRSGACEIIRSKRRGVGRKGMHDRSVAIRRF